MTWFYLALLAPLLFAVINLLDDNLLQHVYRGAAVGTVISGLFALLPAAIILLVKPELTLQPSATLMAAFLAGLITAFGFYFYFRALAIENPSVIVALFCMTSAFLPFAAYVFVGERLSGLAIAGFILLITSAFLYSLSDIRKFKLSVAFIPALLAAIVFDAASLLNKYAYINNEFYQAFLFTCLGIATGGVLFLIGLLLKRQGRTLTSVFRESSYKIILLLAMAEILALSAEFVTDLALSQGPVSLINAIGNIQPLYIVVISVLLYPFFPKLFREAEAGNFKLKVSLLLVMIAGALLATL